MTQFDEVMAKLDDVLQKLDLIARRIGILDQESFEQGLFDDDDQRVPRSLLSYKDINGDTQQIEEATLPADIRGVIEIARQYSDPWELYETPNGNIRFMGSNEVVARYHAKTTPQARPG